MKFVHERPGQIDSSTRFPQQSLWRARIWQAIQIETIALIPNRDRDLLLGSSDRHNHLFLAVYRLP